MGGIKIKAVPTGIDPEELLSLGGYFYLKDVLGVLAPDDVTQYKLAFKIIEKLKKKGLDPYREGGFKKCASRVVVSMERFAAYYRTNLLFHTRRLDKKLSFQDFLKIKGCYFRLSEVTRQYRTFIPPSYGILKRHTETTPRSLETIGIVKYDTTYLVLPEVFGTWLLEEFFPLG